MGFPSLHEVQFIQHYNSSIICGLETLKPISTVYLAINPINKSVPVDEDSEEASPVSLAVIAEVVKKLDPLWQDARCRWDLPRDAPALDAVRLCWRQRHVEVPVVADWGDGFHFQKGGHGERVQMIRVCAGKEALTDRWTFDSGGELRIPSWPCTSGPAL